MASAGQIAGAAALVFGVLGIGLASRARAARAPRVSPPRPNPTPGPPSASWLDFLRAQRAPAYPSGLRVPDPNTPAVQSWRSYFAPYVTALGHAADRPIERVLMWTAIESGGNPCSLDATRTKQLATGHVPDVGPMQLYFETPQTKIHGYTSADLRAGCIGTTQEGTCSPAVRDLQARVSIAWLADQIAVQDARLAALHVQWSPRDRWRWYKFSTHGLPAVALCMLPLAISELGRAPVDWSEFRHTCETIDLGKVRAAAALPQANGCTAALNAHGLWEKAFNNAEEMDLPDERASSLPVA